MYLVYYNYSNAGPECQAITALCSTTFENKCVDGYQVLTNLTLSQTSPGFTCLQYKPFENTVGKGEIARKQAIFNFTTLFYTQLEFSPPFSSSSKLSFANSFSLEESKICCLGNKISIFLSFSKGLIAKVIFWQTVTHMCFLAFSHQH